MGAMDLTLPTEGGDDGTWDTKINTCLTTLEAHDHTSGNGNLVPSTGLNINANLSFGGFKATSMGGVVFSAVAQAATSNASLYRNTSDNELYWKTSGGTNVKLTNGAGINTTLVGGITGDYSTSTADVEYVNSTKTFEIKQAESPNHWAKIKVGDILLLEPTSGITNAVTIKSPTSLAAAYSLTLPTAVPASTSIVMMASSGALSTTLTPSVTSFTATGAVQGATVSGTTSVTTAEADIRHGDRTVELQLAWTTSIGTAPYWVGSIDGSGLSTYGGDAGGTIYHSAKLGVPVGCRLKSISLRVVENTGSAIVTLDVWKRSVAAGGAPGAASQLGTDQSSSNVATNIQALAVTGLTETIVADTTYYATIANTNASTAVAIYACFVTYDRP